MEPRWLPGVHWELSERYTRALAANDVAEFPAPPNLFKLEWVDTDRVAKHTRRQFPPWQRRSRRFGEVLPGNWDRRAWPPLEPEYSGPPPELFVADRFEDSVLHRSFEAHFDRGVPWEETRLHEETTRLVEEGDRSPVWHNCRTVEDLHSRFRYLGDLYERIRGSRFRSQRELVATDPRRGFPHWLRNEITVDVGRDGELLLVCGKHRLSIAKLLDVDRVPVLFLVRHPDWMERRRAAVETGRVGDHPDLRDLREHSP